MINLRASVELLVALGDPTRVRLLSLLAREELSVAELTSVTELPQSRVSSHLSRLRDARMVRDRKVGASSRYSLNDGGMPEQARDLWGLLSEKLDDNLIAADLRRLEQLMRARRSKTPWLDSVAGEMERHYSPGRTWEATARGLLGFAALGDLVDIGCGDGAITELVAPRAKSVTCADQNARMIDAASRRLGRFEGARFVVADMHELPFEAESFDDALCFNALTYAREPALALRQIRHVLRPAGRLVLLCLHRHSHQAIASQYGHLHPGFTRAGLDQLLGSAGFEVLDCNIACRERRKPYFEVLIALARATSSPARRDGTLASSSTERRST